MNETLVNILNDELNDSELSTALPPAQLRNLASPIRFSTIPDLELTEFEGNETEQQPETLSDASSSESESIESNLAIDRMQVAHRLMLSLARQNTTNQNTFVFSTGSPHGVLLQRLNAVRARKYRKPASAETAKEVLAQFEKAVDITRSSPYYSGKLPLFGALHLKASRRWRRPRVCGMDIQMDRLMQLRREERKRGAEETVGSRKRRKMKGDKVSSQRLGLFLKLIKTEFRARHLVRNKRKSAGESKREEIEEKTKSKTKDVLSCGDDIPVIALSDMQRSRIISSVPCLFLQNGSSFQLGRLSQEGNWSPLHYGVDLTVSQVDHDAKRLGGFFSVRSLPSNGPLSSTVYSLGAFLRYLLGSAQECTKGIHTRASVVNDAFLELERNGMHSPFEKGFNVAFTGEIIDFNNHDLRFMQTKPPGNSFSRAMHVSRVHNEQVKAQLGEWLRIRPFHDFSEAFFVNYLLFVRRRLGQWGRCSRNEQELSLDFAGGFRDSMHHIAGRFAFASKSDYFGFGKSPRTDNVRLFVGEWNTKLCEKLCDHMCDERTLLNVQLNYVLFTLRVDMLSLLDHVFECSVRNMADTGDKHTLLQRYAEATDISNKPNDTVFVCSLNRKTGRLELHNTRHCLESMFAHNEELESEDEELALLRFQTLPSMFRDKAPQQKSMTLYGKWSRSVGTSSADSLWEAC